jgi:hypothetical protein
MRFMDMVHAPKYWLCVQYMWWWGCVKSWLRIIANQETFYL